MSIFNEPRTMLSAFWLLCHLGSHNKPMREMKGLRLRNVSWPYPTPGKRCDWELHLGQSRSATHDLSQLTAVAKSPLGVGLGRFKSLPKTDRLKLSEKWTGGGNARQTHWGRGVTDPLLQLSLTCSMDLFSRLLFSSLLLLWWLKGSQGTPSRPNGILRDLGMRGRSPQGKRTLKTNPICSAMPKAISPLGRVVCRLPS